MEVLHEPADHAVLPSLGRQREAVLQRLRRHAGQLVLLWPIALADAVGCSDQRLVRGQRGRWVPDSQRSGRSVDRLCAVAGRRHSPLQPQDRAGTQHSSTAVTGGPWLRRRGRRDAGAAATGAASGCARGCAEEVRKGVRREVRRVRGVRRVRRVRRVHRVPSRGAAVEDVGPAIAPTGIRPT